MGKQALAGVKVVGFTYAGTANMTMRTLGMHGATVVRVESEVRPCNLRTAGPYKDGKPGINRSGYFATFNNDRYSLALNLKHPRAPWITERLIRWADVMIENFSPGTMERLGLDYETVRKLNPNIIMLSISQQGQTGPHAHMPGYGPTAQGLTGHITLCGWPNGSPVLIDQSYPDFIAPVYGAIAVIAALDYRRRTGKGQYIDLSNYECALQWLVPVLLDYIVNQRIQQRQGNKLPHAAPHGAYKCQGNDEWCVISVFTDTEWKDLCRTMGDPAWSKELKFATLSCRKQHEDQLNENMERWTEQFTADEIVEKLQKAGVAAGKVGTCADVVQDPQLRHRQHFRGLPHPELGYYEYHSPPYILSNTPAEVSVPAPLLGEHTEYICKQLLGMPEEEFLEFLLDGEVFK